MEYQDWAMMQIESAIDAAAADERLSQYEKEQAVCRDLSAVGIECGLCRKTDESVPF